VKSKGQPGRKEGTGEEGVGVGHWAGGAGMEFNIYI